MQKFRQQGDVLITPIEAVPHGAKKVASNIIMEGEFTGHAHRIIGEATILEMDGIKFLQNNAPVELIHEEHGQQTIPAGIYKIGVVKEFDPFEEEIRNVQD